MSTHLPPYTGSHLERWRVDHGLSKTVAANAFGLPQAKWIELTSEEHCEKPLTDPVLAMLLLIYDQYPESAPLPRQTDVKEFYEFLGLRDTPQDRDRFAALIGRSPPTAYRLLLHDGTAGRPLACWIEALKRLNLSPTRALRLMGEITGEVTIRQKLASSDLPEEG